jgi:tyrosine-protein phosphatase SIW14
VRFPKLAAWIMAVAIAAFMAGVPFVYYRYNYTYGKRLRPVVEGQFYRSGCMTAEGFANAIRTLHIKTVINLMEDNTDPDLPSGYFDLSTINESKVCERQGARMVNLTVDLIEPYRLPTEHPVAIDTFRELMDRPETYPVLIHCRAGLHRTGVMVAVYRMEYQGWTHEEAMSELKAHGFGEYAANAANDYIAQYVLNYKREPRHLSPDRVRGSIGPGY